MDTQLEQTFKELDEIFLNNLEKPNKFIKKELIVPELRVKKASDILFDNLSPIGIEKLKFPLRELVYES